ncbi:hypothetical protein [Streptomyces melanogenes]|uniref:hypothetical protein n=1 Tax=Streptomyces melanogenes TaxID=67326 RepID=UPI003793662F
MLSAQLDAAHTLHGWMIMRDKAARGEPVPAASQLRPGDVVVADEAGMAGTVLLRRVLDDAQAAGALWLIAREAGAAELTDLHRFTTDGEAAATLALRDEPPEDAFAWYLDHRRLLGGDEEAMLHAVFAAWQHDITRGHTSLMTAEEVGTVTALKQRAQAYLAATGRREPATAACCATGCARIGRPCRHPRQRPSPAHPRRPGLRQER